MSRFSFKGRKLSGELFEETREAKDKFDLAKILHEEGVTVLTAYEVVEHESHVNALFERFFGKVKLKEKNTIC
jgi:hypothetical protein